MNPRSLEARDRWLERTARELLSDNKRSFAADLTIHCDGGVAHLDGHVATDSDRAAVRRIIGSLRGVYAVWDGLHVGAQTALTVVDLGCGETKQRPGAVGLDRWAHPGVDVVGDIAAGLPFADDSIDRVYAVHVLEHVDVIAAMNEIHRVLTPTGTLHVLSPDRRHVNAYADPTHIRFFDVQTFKYFCTAHGPVRRWFPLHAASDGASIFADLAPVKAGGASMPGPEDLGLFFD